MSDHEQPTLAEVQSELEQLRERIDKIEGRLNAGETSDTGSLREFIRKVDPESHVEAALAVVYYRTEIEGGDPLTKDEVEAGFREARLKQPSNMADALNGCEDRDWLIREQADDGIRRTVSLDGIQYIEEEVLSDDA